MNIYIYRSHEVATRVKLEIFIELAKVLFPLMIIRDTFQLMVCQSNAHVQYGEYILPVM